MNQKRIGRRTIALTHPPSVLSFSNIGGKFEGQGPLGTYFDEICDDAFFGEKTWEKAESAMQKKVLQRALDRAHLTPGDLDYIFAGDLLNQCISSSYSVRDNDIPYSWGTAVNVQMMVFGNMGETSGTGVAFTRDPATGEKKLMGDERAR